MKRDIIIDADHIAFLVANSKTYQTGFEVDEDADTADDWGEGFDTLLTQKHKDHFQAIVDDYIMTIEVEAIVMGWKLSGVTKVIMSDKRNFRYDVYKHYKAKRPPSSQLLSELKAWARGYYMFEKNTEADDVVAYYVREGGIGVTTDKDLFKGVAGIWYNSHYHYRCFVYLNKEDAEYFFKCQILAGDGVDGIPSIDMVGIITADKLLKKYGSSYEDIVKIFALKGHNEKYMVTMARLVSMTQWTPKKGIKLWKLPKK